MSAGREHVAAFCHGVIDILDETGARTPRASTPVILLAARIEQSVKGFAIGEAAVASEVFEEVLGETLATRGYVVFHGYTNVSERVSLDLLRLTQPDRFIQ